MCKQELESLRVSIIECYDENRDGKIEILEMTRFLPVEDNFLLYFRLTILQLSTCFIRIIVLRLTNETKNIFPQKVKLR